MTVEYRELESWSDGGLECWIPKGPLSSLWDFLFRMGNLPSHKWLGYFRQNLPATMLKIDFPGDRVESGIGVENSPGNTSNRPLENSPALQRWETCRTNTRVPEGRKNHYSNPMVVNRPLSSLRDFLFWMDNLPSHKWLGYFRQNFPATMLKIDFPGDRVESGAGLENKSPRHRFENSPALQRWETRRTNTRVPQGRKNHYFNPMVANRPLSSLWDFLFWTGNLPSHKWLGYFRQNFPATMLKIDFPGDRVESVTGLENSPSNTSNRPLENSPALQRWVTCRTNTRVPPGRKNHYFNPMVVNRPLSSLRDFLFWMGNLPSHKWLGYFRQNFPATMLKIDFPGDRVESGAGLENSRVCKSLIFHKISQNSAKNIPLPPHAT